MRLDVLSFLIVLAILIYAKKGGKLGIPKLTGLGKVLNFSTESERVKMILEIFVVIGVIIWLSFITDSIVIKLVKDNTQLAILIAVVTVLYVVFKTPKSAWFLWMELGVLVVLAVFATLPETTQKDALAWRPWSTEPPKGTATVPQVAQGPKKTVLSVMLTEPGVPMEIGNIPDFSRFEAGDFNCPPNTTMLVVHRGEPNGKPPYDCDSATEEIKLGNDNRGLRIWFVLKQGAPPKEVTIVATAKS
ncbi:MAG: hypothetical protein AAB552_00200 [Patescibacteria group bacterium]